MNSKAAGSFGTLLRELRLSRKLTQELLAQRARLSKDAVSALERGHRRAPYPHTLGLLEQALELDGAAQERFRAAAAHSATERRELPAHGMQREAGGRHNFPERVTRFVGRDEEMSVLADAIAGSRLTTITGTGGVGKTRIAIELGVGVQSRYRCGARFIELGPLRDSALLPQEIAAALQLRETPGQTVLDNIVTTLKEQQILLVIDNCEHLIVEAARVLETILLRCAQVTIVATSREALRIDGEFVFRLPTFPVPASAASYRAETAILHSSVALFVERAQSVDPSFALRDANVFDITRICQRVDGIPLALEIVAAHIAHMEPAQIASRLQQRFLFATESRTAAPRQRTLRSLVGWSVDLLSAAENVVFRRLSVFTGAWTVEAAEAVCAGNPIAPEGVLDCVQSLVAKSLIIAEINPDGRRRLRLLEMTRNYARELLVKRDEFEAVMTRHTAYVLAFARRARSSAAATPDLAWLEAVEREIDNARSVLEWSLHLRNDVAAGAEVAALLGHYWDARSYDEGTRWLALSRAVVDELEPDLAARVLLESVRIQPYLDDAFPLVQRALAKFRRLENNAGMCAALEALAKTLINLGRYREARDALNEAIALAHDFADAAAILRLTTTLAFAQLYDGDTEAARATFALATSAVPDGPDGPRNRSTADLLRGSAELALIVGDMPRALGLAATFLAEIDEFGEKRETAAAHALVAQTLLAADRLTDAATEAARALGALRGSEFPLAYLEATIVAAAICERRHDDVRAAQLIGSAQRRASMFAFRPTPLSGALLAGTVDALVRRMRPADFRFLTAQGRTFDEDRVAAECLSAAAD